MADPWTVSAVVTTYQRPEKARRAVRSVLAQTHRPLEIIVVEDGSESDLEQWLAEQGHPEIRYVRHRTNRGLAAARNSGLAAARGEYVAYLDDDDEWRPERLARQTALLEALPPEQRRRLGVVYCAVEMRDPARGTSRIVAPLNQGDLRESIIREGPRTLPSTCLYPKAVLEAVNGFNEALVSSIDHDMWLTLAANGYEARALEDALVVSYPAGGRLTMTTDAPRRIAGVRQFIGKWQPTFQAWIGEPAGRRFVHRYFARAILRLAASEFASGRLAGGLRCLWTIVCFGNKPVRNILAVTEVILGRYASRPRKRNGMARRSGSSAGWHRNRRICAELKGVSHQGHTKPSGMTIPFGNAIDVRRARANPRGEGGSWMFSTLAAERRQEIQGAQYDYPYHYLPEHRGARFRQARHWSWGWRYLGGLTMVMNELAEAGEVPSLVDVGCGDGRFLREVRERYPNARIFGVDSSERAIALARALNPSIEYRSADVARDDLVGGYDFATLIEVLEHIEPRSIPDFLAGIKRLLTPGGRLIVTVPHVNKPVSDKHFQHFSIADLRRTLEPTFFVEKTLPFDDVKSLKLKMAHRLIGGEGRRFVLTNGRLLSAFYRHYLARHLYLEDESRCGRVMAVASAP